MTERIEELRRPSPRPPDSLTYRAALTPSGSSVAVSRSQAEVHDCSAAFSEALSPFPRRAPRLRAVLR